MLVLALLSCSENVLPTRLQAADRAGHPGHPFHFVADVDESSELTWVLSLAPESSQAWSEGEVLGTGRTLEFWPDVEGDFEILLEACNDRGCLQRRVIASAKVPVDGSAPVAEAGDDQFLELGDSAVLDGGMSFHPAGGALDYAWSFVTVPEDSVLIDEDIVDRFEAFAQLDGDVPGDFEIRLVVDDGVTTASDTTLVSFSEPDWWDPDEAPVASPGMGGMAAVGETIQLDASESSDAEGQELSFSWSFKLLPADSELGNSDIQDRDQAKASFVPDVEGEYGIRVAVSDGNSTSTAVTRWAVSGGNQPPVALAGSDFEAMWAQYVNLDGSESYDPDGDALSYRWGFVSQPETSGLANADLVDRYTDHASFTPDVSGEYELKLVVMDGTDQDVDRVVVSVSEQSEDNPPVADCGITEPTTEPGELVVLDASQSFDPEGEELAYRWSFASLPADSALTDQDLKRRFTAVSRFRPDVEGTYLVELVIDDGSLVGGCGLHVEVFQEAENQAPVARTNGDQYLVMGETAELNGRLSFDSDGDELSYRWAFVRVPESSALSNSDISDRHSVQGSFVPDAPGLYRVRLVVDDGQELGRDTAVIRVDEGLPE